MFFVLQTEAPLLIRPYLKDMTKSEIHAVLTGGFATIAGSVMGAFISFGVRWSCLHNTQQIIHTAHSMQKMQLNTLNKTWKTPKQEH